MERIAERRSRIQRKERGVVSTGSPEQDSDGTRLRFDQLGVRASQLKLPYYRASTEDDRWDYQLATHKFGQETFEERSSHVLLHAPNANLFSQYFGLACSASYIRLRQLTEMYKLSLYSVQSVAQYQFYWQLSVSWVTSAPMQITRSLSSRHTHMYHSLHFFYWIQ